MANAGNAIIYLEQGQAEVDFVALTNAGDRRTFTSADPVWSRAISPDIRPDGMITGSSVGSPSATVDAVSVAAFSAYSGGVKHDVAANDALAITRPDTDVAKVISVTMDDSGALAEVEGTPASDTTFVATRGVAGGPPLIPVGSVELFQIRTTSSAEAVFSASEIYQIVGTHTERYDFPGWNVSAIGKGVESTVDGQDEAHIYFDSALPAIHTGDIPKQVFVKYYTPVFGELARTLDFSSSSLGQGGFTALLDDGVADALVQAKNKNLTVKFHPDRDKTSYIITQGRIGIARSFPVSDQIQATVTITAEEASVEFAG